MRAFVWGVCPDGFIGLLGPCGETGPIEKGNWNSTVWKFQLFRGAYRPQGFWRYRIVVGIYLGGSSPTGLLNYWAPAGKRGRSRTATGTLLTGIFSYFTGSIDRWVSAVTRPDWPFIWAGMPRLFIQLLGASGEAGPIEN